MQKVTHFANINLYVKQTISYIEKPKGERWGNANNNYKWIKIGLQLSKNPNLKILP